VFLKKDLDLLLTDSVYEHCVYLLTFFFGLFIFVSIHGQALSWHKLYIYKYGLQCVVSSILFYFVEFVSQSLFYSCNLLTAVSRTSRFLTVDLKYYIPCRDIVELSTLGVAKLVDEFFSPGDVISFHFLFFWRISPRKFRTA
jgi:hypothetical protein